MVSFINKHLKDKTPDRYGTCRLCGARVFCSRQKIESHLRSNSCIQAYGEENARYQGIIAEGDKEESVVQRSPQNLSTKLNDYNLKLQQFKMLSLMQKRRYLRNRAPDDFIRMVRECLVNLNARNISCDDTVVQRVNTHYGCKRLCDKNVNNREARLHLTNTKTLEILCKVLPIILNHFNSFVY